MAALSTDKFTEVGNPGTATTLAAPGHAVAGTTINVVSTTNWPTATGVAFAMDVVQLVNGVETRVPGTYTEWVGVVTGATTIASMTLTYGTDRTYTAGPLTRVYIPVSSTRENRLAQGMLVQHNQDGTHGAVTATSLNVAGAATVTGGFTLKAWDGWITPTDTWTYASATTFTIAGVDKTALFPVGTKIKLTQTTVKYFYVTARSFATDTTITVNGGSTYSLANAAITSPSYSYMSLPQGFPAIVDANGWTVSCPDGKFDYRQRQTFSVTKIAGEYSTVSTVSLPVGMATIGSNFVSATMANGFIDDTLHGVKISSTTSTSLVYSFKAAASATFAGWVDWAIRAA